MPNLAILIDAENVLPIHADQIFTHASSLGTITVKEIYGAAAALTAWVEPVLKYALHANLTIKASKGKNTSDIALVIGAMDLLVAGNIDTVVIVSSDSDFSALSVRLRSAGIEIVGMGTEKANPLWRTACSSFIVLQAPVFRPAPVQQQPTRSQPAAKAAVQKQEAPAAANPSKKKTVTKAVAPTHTGRMSIITAFIKEQLEANNGRMAVSVLLPALNGLPEYRVDQQRSKRNAHNYLMRLYGDTFAFEEGEGGSFISLKPNAPAPSETPAEPAEAPVEAEESPESGVTEQEPAEPLPEQEEETAGAEPEEKPDEQTQAIEAFAGKLVDAGIPEDAARQIIQILNENNNLRTVYNKMRVVFGGDIGRKYYQIVKEVGQE